MSTNRQPPMTVPIALLNYVHFCGVTELLPEAPYPRSTKASMQCSRPLAWTYAQALAGHGKPTQLARKTARTLTLPPRPQEMQLR